MATATASKISAKLPEAKNVGSALDQAMNAGKGILRLSPTWVPRSFLHPGKRVRLHPDDYYSYGLTRGVQKSERREVGLDADDDLSALLD